MCKRTQNLSYRVSLSITQVKGPLLNCLQIRNYWSTCQIGHRSVTKCYKSKTFGYKSITFCVFLHEREKVSKNRYWTILHKLPKWYLIPLRNGLVRIDFMLLKCLLKNKSLVLNYIMRKVSFWNTLMHTHSPCRMAQWYLLAERYQRLQILLDIITIIVF